ISKREICYISYLDHIDLDAFDDFVIGPYYKINYDVRKMKCIITVIKDTKDNLIGTRCINLDVSVVYIYQKFINAFINN
ncbi:PAS domain-containing protein, partial [Francisella tularensis subsp. holarctica]|uniref:PAS domain-containing protein n=1 Tax=Francisella tularensis TaxID=263 RepID=UPI002381C563